MYDQRLLETFSAYQGYWGENLHAEAYHFFNHTQELGGETLVDIQKRMANFWKECTRDLHENILICSHGDPIQVLYASIHNLPLTNNSKTETNIPGWIEKGEFIELIYEDGKLTKTITPKQQQGAILTVYETKNTQR